jgi:hypothetical protein
MADQVEVTVVESDPVVVIVEAAESEASTVVVIQEGVQGYSPVIGDTDLPPSAEIKGMLRYREPQAGSVLAMCMKKTDGTYGWIDLVEEV